MSTNRPPTARPGGLVLLTGTPGTGKKSLAPLLGSAFGLRPVSLNSLFTSAGLVDANGTVRTEDSRLWRTIEGKFSEALLFGHLSTYVVPPPKATLVFVLRCRPEELRRRLEARRYPRSKVRENIEAELIGVIAAHAYSKFGMSKVVEVDTTTRSPEESSAEAFNLAQEGVASPQVDWASGYRSAEKLRSLLSPV